VLNIFKKIKPVLSQKPLAFLLERVFARGSI